MGGPGPSALRRSVKRLGRFRGEERARRVHAALRPAHLLYSVGLGPLSREFEIFKKVQDQHIVSGPCTIYEPDGNARSDYSSTRVSGSTRLASWALLGLVLGV